jgi:hypothetical protein
VSRKVRRKMGDEEFAGVKKFAEKREILREIAESSFCRG